MRQKGSSNVFLVLGVIGILVVGLYIFSQSKNQNYQSPQQQMNNNSATPSVSKKITYQLEVSTSSKIVLIELDNTKEALYVADKSLSEDSKKLIYKFDLPGAMGFLPPVITAEDYLIMAYKGAGANDIVIFTPEGKVITEGIRKSNTEISKWIVSNEIEVLKDDRIKVQLFRINNSRAEAIIELSTGKLIPNSFKNLPKAS